MKNPVARALLLLAVSDNRLGELHQFFRWVRDAGPDRATKLVDEMRYDLNRYDDLPINARSLLNPYGPTGKSSNRSTSQRLQQLLLDETGLSKSEAADLLISELDVEKLNKQLPSYNKISFEIWLERMIDRVGPNRLLQVASRIRSRAKEDPHWPLKRD